MAKKTTNPDISVTLSTGKKIVITATGIKDKPTGKAKKPSAVLLPLSKGDRRKARKVMRAAGHLDLVHQSLEISR